ncbi:hypothetical protein GQ53DRAFT_741759 [Thozetella sp. PMI_491]|nr:hypothetical protein GQ53DRAFT_741759 [Thozetella sp. PMI_491]
MGLVSQKDLDKWSSEKFPTYTPEEKAQLSKVYSAEQMAALEAGEAAIDPNDLTIQGRLRKDNYRLPYLDDFRNYEPVVDKRPRDKPPPDPKAKFMDLDEFTDDIIAWADELGKKQRAAPSKTVEDFIPEGFKSIPEAEWPPEARQVAADRYAKYMEKQDKGLEVEGADDFPLFSYMLDRSSMTDNNAESNSQLAPALPNKVPGVAGLYSDPVDPEDEGLDDLGVYKSLKAHTGLSVREIMDIKCKVLVQRIVVNQTRLGKIRSYSVMAVAGNGNGWLGLGMAKSTESTTAVERAKELSIRNMRPIPRYENRTIFGNVEAKAGGTVVQLFARPPGFGLRIPYRLFEMARAAGIHDLAAKMPRGRNPMNSVKACYDALMNQKNPEEIAIGRGQKLVDVRKVYYGGAVL